MQVESELQIQKIEKNGIGHWRFTFKNNITQYTFQRESCTPNDKVLMYFQVGEDKYISDQHYNSVICYIETWYENYLNRMVDKLK
jgi:hypothetical protein